MGAITEVKKFENQTSDVIPTRNPVEIRGQIVQDYPIAGGISNIDEIRGEVKKKRRR